MKRSDLKVGDEVAVGKASYKRRRAVVLSLKPEPILGYHDLYARNETVDVPYTVRAAAKNYVTVAICTGGDSAEWKPAHASLMSIQHSWAQEEAAAIAQEEAAKTAQEAAKTAQEEWKDYLDRIAASAAQTGLKVEQVSPEKNEYGWVEEWDRGWRIDGIHYSYLRPVTRMELRRETLEALLKGTTAEPLKEQS